MFAPPIAQSTERGICKVRYCAKFVSDVKINDAPVNKDWVEFPVGARLTLLAHGTEVRSELDLPQLDLAARFGLTRLALVSCLCPRGGLCSLSRSLGLLSGAFDPKHAGGATVWQGILRLSPIRQRRDDAVVHRVVSMRQPSPPPLCATDALSVSPSSLAPSTCQRGRHTAVCAASSPPCAALSS